MKKLTILLILSCLLALTGCNPLSREEDMKNQDSYSGDFYVEEQTHDSEEIDKNIGSQVEETGEELPQDLYGSWSVTQGLPPELREYTLTISQDGAVEQKTTDASGNTTTSEGRCVSTKDGYAIVNDSGMVLLNLKFENGQLTSDSLTSEPVTFTKTA